MRHAPPLAAIALVLPALAGCAGDDSPDPVVLAWSADPGALENPWPSDRLFSQGVAGTPDGYFTRMLPADPAYDGPRAFLEAAVAELGTATGGYSVYAPIVLPAEARIGAGAAAGIHLVPEAGGPEVDLTVRWSEPMGALLAEPVTPLLGSTRYAVLIAGSRTAASDAFEAARASDPAVAALVDLAVSRGFAGKAGSVDLAFAFTTQPVADDLVAAQARIDGPIGDDILPAYVDSAGLPFIAGVHTAGSLAFDEVFQENEASPQGIGVVAQGVFAAYEFRDANGSFDSALVHGTGALPSRATVDFRLTVPAGDPPAGGWPVVIASHGVSGDSVEPLKRGYSFALAGAATIGATATDHGWRGSILDFFDFTRPLYVRDGFRQSALEIVQLERAIRNGHDAGVPPFDRLDPERVTYFGNSFGGIVGGSVAAASAHVDAVGISVSGGRLPRLFDGETGQLLLALFGGEVGLPKTDPEFDGFLEGFRIAAQWAIDPADPAALGPAVPVDRPVLIQMALGDGTIPNASSEDLRLALALPVLEEPADPFDGRGGLWVWDVAEYPAVDAEPHDLYWDLAPMRHQMEQFLLSEGTVLVDD